MSRVGRLFEPTNRVIGHTSTWATNQSKKIEIIIPNESINILFY